MLVTAIAARCDIASHTSAVGQSQSVPAYVGQCQVSAAADIGAAQADRPLPVLSSHSHGFGERLFMAESSRA